MSSVPIVLSFILAWRVLPLAKVWINHLFLVPSYWIGCPASLGFLSDTRLIILNFWLESATEFIKIGSAKSALVLDDAILIWRFESSLSFPPTPVPVIAKYTVCGSIFSGKSPSSARILIDSPFCN